MNAVNTILDAVERVARRCAAPLLRFALATLMLWFGIPKLFDGVSPAQDLAVRTVSALSGGLVEGDAARFAIAGFEIALGLALLVGQWMPLVLLAVLGHIVGTSTPLLLFPTETWGSPMVGTMEGQYIIKNLLILSGVVTLAALGMRRRPLRRH
jgi:uncharacterized membrane protein YphA (DoxX/SURF4 family)